MYFTLVAAFTLALTATAASGQVPPAAADALDLSYDDLMRSSADVREATLRQMDVAQRVALTWIHARRWLERNRWSLSASQVAVVQEAIDFTSPERDRDPRDPVLMKQEADIAHRLACSLGEQRAKVAFTFRDEPTAADRSWSGFVGSWAQWLVECLVR